MIAQKNELSVIFAGKNIIWMVPSEFRIGSKSVIFYSSVLRFCRYIKIVEAYNWF
jgi:hypothetical protein